MFEPGDRVRVLSSEKPGHVRTPAYLKGKAGWVGVFDRRIPQPGRDRLRSLRPAERPLYRVG